MKLHADLVVLSACETGYGKIASSEGAMSLARSFMFAKVSSMVVSMWQVNDASTVIIMQSFYTKLAKSQDKATALQQAKLEFIKNVDPKAAHPAFWARFIWFGNSNAIALPTTYSSKIWLVWP